MLGGILMLTFVQVFTDTAAFPLRDFYPYGVSVGHVNAINPNQLCLRTPFSEGIGAEIGFGAETVEVTHLLLYHCQSFINVRLSVGYFVFRYSMKVGSDGLLVL